MKNILKLALLCSITLSCTTNTQSKKQTKQKTKKEPNSCVCMEIYRPVCANDGRTYANSCEADCLGLRYTDGECN